MGVRLPWDQLSPQTLIFAAAVGLACGLTWLILRYGLQTVLDETLAMTRGVFAWATGHAIERRAGGAGPWFCSVCHSQNLATSKRCYHGCGKRSAVEDRIEPATEPNAATRSGTSRRRY